MWSLFDSHPEFSAEDAARLRRVERKLDLILQHLGIADPEPAGDPFPEAARRHAERGEKIAAIKAYREGTGAGLAEAKRAVEAYIRR